tara:strand:- start:273 stop:389 length:117 start_codon:yes stop_codon:yes gene_type:complete
MALPCKCEKPNVKITKETIIPICKTCGRAVCQKIEDDK